MEEVIKILSFFGLAEQAVVTGTYPTQTICVLCLLYDTPDIGQGSVPGTQDGFIIHGGGPE